MSADGFEARTRAVAPAVFRQPGKDAERVGTRRARFRGRARRRASARRADARGRHRRAACARASALPPTRVLATPSGRNAAGRRVDRRSPRRRRDGHVKRGFRARHAADRRAAKTISGTELSLEPIPFASVLPRRWSVSYLGRSHATEVHGGLCGVFSAGKRDGSRESRRGSLGSGVADERVVCADVVDSACTGVRRAGGSALGRRGTALSTPRKDLERDGVDRAFAQFPEPSIPRVSVSIRRASGSQTSGSCRMRI